ncbi:laminin subunit alpha-like, partial [Galleria mellonella]|uniref:Laminin subunit alpha-like n=1 Tax=Galleria mellonella TaxID=7137 RepID=A0ABM3MY59_GALME
KCQSGQIIWKGCNQCICQEDGQLDCTASVCYEETTTVIAPLILREKLSTMSPWCTPLKSYYVNCSICVCPTSGWTSEATCTLDTSCLEELPSDFITNKNVCIPNVMYLFPCLRCLCSDSGYFILDKCIETCNITLNTESPRRCTSKTFYRKNCNVCWCPEDSIPDEKYCTNVVCNKNPKFKYLENFRRGSLKCVPGTFTKAKCYYCDCNTKGYVNENACLELDCLKSSEFKYDTSITKKTCSPGEMVPICIECFCLDNGQTNSIYCTRECSYISKLNVLQKVLKDSLQNRNLIDVEAISKTTANEFCKPNTVYIDQGRYCLCPENDSTSFKLCSSVTEHEIYTTRSYIKITDDITNEVFNKTCKPNTFVEINCNTCYCSKDGTVDVKWCTYDDCEAKRIVQQKIKQYLPIITIPEFSDTCTPGSISKVDCNFCICPDSGVFKERVCTKNACDDLEQSVNNDALTCEPLEYYIVDCNTCFCPRDGFKNVARCTKNVCEKNFLRSDSCVPGQLFSEDCNVCVCPPNSNKADRACTNHICTDLDTPWKRIFMLSQSLSNRHSLDDSTRKLDICFPGEEFEVDCKVCICPDMGLRAYASCTQILCDDEIIHKNYVS